MIEVRIYYITRNPKTIRGILDKFHTIRTVNNESTIRTNEYGLLLLEEVERRGYITIREKTIKE